MTLPIGAAIAFVLALGPGVAAAAGTPPVNISPPTISGTSQDGMTLTAQPGTWTGSPAPTLRYQWRRCDTAGSSCANISGASAQTYTLAHADVGKTIRVVVTAKNSGGSTSATSTQTSVIAAAPPANTTRPTVSGTAQVGQTLKASAGTWTGSPPLTYGYQWLRCDSSGSNCNAVSGANSTGYSLGSADVGFTLEVAVTASNSVGSQTANSASSAVVTNPGAPVNSSPPTISGTAQAGQALTGSPGTWSGTAPINYAYQWLRCDSAGANCAAISGANSTGYSLGSADVGFTFVFAVTASNAGGSATAYSAATAVVTSASTGGDPVIAAAGDISCDPFDPSYNGGLGTSQACQQQATSNLLVNGGFAAVLALGDLQYDCGALSEFQASYDPTWGRLKSITFPVPGNHEYISSNPDAFGQSDCSTNATGYFSYWGAVAGNPSQGYYSFDVGSWHIVALNTNNWCATVACDTGSPQEQWLNADLAAHAAKCTLAYWHEPRFSSDSAAAGSDSAGFWQDLYAAGADVVLNGHAHVYERFAPQTPSAAADTTKGITEFTVGTGGESHASFDRTAAVNSLVRNSTAFGVLELTLHPTSYDWKFVPTAGGTLSDSGSANCH